MSATYTDPPVSDRDFVRLFIGDTKVTPSTSVQLTDETIDALLGEQSLLRGSAAGSLSLKYFCAASALEVLLTKYASGGKGLKLINISGLSVSQGVDAQTLEALRAQIATYRTKGIRQLALERNSKGTAMFKAAENPACRVGGYGYY